MILLERQSKYSSIQTEVPDKHSLFKHVLYCSVPRGMLGIIFIASTGTHSYYMYYKHANIVLQIFLMTVKKGTLLQFFQYPQIQYYCPT